MPISTPPWPATSAAAARTTVSARRSNTPPRGRDMSRGLLEARNRRAPEGLNRRTFLKLGVSVGAAAGGGLLLGFSLPAASQGEAPKGKSVIGGDGVETPQGGVLDPKAFVQMDNTGKVTLAMPKVEMAQAVYTSIPMLIAEELEVP